MTIDTDVLAEIEEREWRDNFSAYDIPYGGPIIRVAQWGPGDISASGGTGGRSVDRMIDDALAERVDASVRRALVLAPRVPAWSPFGDTPASGGSGGGAVFSSDGSNRPATPDERRAGLRWPYSEWGSWLPPVRRPWWRRWLRRK